MKWIDFILVFIGGGLGSLTRWQIGKYLSSINWIAFPYSTFLINLAASFILGLLAGSGRGQGQWLFWAVGFCGGFSTFSSFSQESIELIRLGKVLPALLYIFLSLIVCLPGFALGWAVSNRLRSI